MGEIASYGQAVIAGLLIGTAGSLHCLGMCGPLVLSLPVHSNSTFRFFTERLVYHVGRISVYATLGGIGGALGNVLSFGRWQQGISIILGTLMIVASFYVAGKIKLPFIERIKFSIGGKLMLHAGKRIGYARFFLMGLANGLLPCGLVYIALAGSLVGSNPVWGAIYMTSFGFGSVPVLLIVSWLGLKASNQLRPIMQRVVPYLLFTMGLLITLRGMDLGIPMISPQIKPTASQEQPQMECCNKPTH